MSKIVILGGGIAGMSAAHELVVRGFEVDVYTQDSAEREYHSTTSENPIFHGYYRHLFDTLRRIPIGNSQSVADNLTEIDPDNLDDSRTYTLTKSARFPRSKRKLQALLRSLFNGDHELSPGEISDFADKVWPLLTSCKERRLAEFERLSWWQYLDTDQHCNEAAKCPYKTFLVQGLTLTSSSARAESMSVRTGVDLLLQRIIQLLYPLKYNTRSLKGPTHEAWLAPWRNFLTNKGVRFHDGYKVTDLTCDVRQKKIIRATIKQPEDGIPLHIEGDYYISALPIHQMVQLVNDNMFQVDASLRFLANLDAHTHAIEESRNGTAPQLMNQAHSWPFRPEAYGQIRNLMLAANYVRTNTALYAMEGANEAARRAVNAILLSTRSKAPFCDIWDQHEPLILAPLRWLDYRRYRRGLSWSEQVPLLDGILHNILHLYHRVTKRV